MQEITINRTSINVQALDDALRTALGATTIGVSTRPGQVTVHLLDTATPQQLDQVRAILQAHDPAQLTAVQQRRLDRAALIDQLRGQNPIPLNPADFNAETDAIRRLARKIAWLEQEIKELRDL
jgi:hypothetical protein